ncbi:hypothetical protein ACE1TH_01910 [Shouchella sp. JSM 1781072]|nr:hypothetical protein [Bacillus sp. Marseille-P3800]
MDKHEQVANDQSGEEVSHDQILASYEQGTIDDQVTEQKKKNINVTE